MLLLILLVKLPTLVILSWAFWQPQEVFRLSLRRWGVLLVAGLHLLFTVLSLFGEKTGFSELFVAYPLLWAVVFRGTVRKCLGGQFPRWCRGLTICGLLWAEELFVVVDHHSPPVRHLVHYFGFYLGITATVLLFFGWFRYSVLQTFWVGGLWGVLIEQHFAGPTKLLSGAVEEFIGFALYIFPVYGLYLAGPRLLFFEEFNQTTRGRIDKMRLSSCSARC